MREREQGSAAAVFGIIALIFFVCIVVAAYPAVMGSTAQDAIENNITNSSHASAYENGMVVSEGFMGFNEALLAFIVIVAIISAALLIWSL